MKHRTYFVYILTNQRNGTLYVGVTNDLKRRVMEHKNKEIEGFTKKYRLDKLVYFDFSDSIESAIAYEKKIKRWKRAWKLKLIEEKNPQWKDLYDIL